MVEVCQLQTCVDYNYGWLFFEVINVFTISLKKSDTLSQILRKNGNTNLYELLCFWQEK